MNTWRIALLVFLLQNVGSKPLPAGIHGVVVRADTGEPIAGAVVHVNRHAFWSGRPMSATAGADGRFSISNLEPDDYRVGASHPSFVESVYGQDDRSVPPPPLTLAVGDRAEIRIEMAPAGVITGQVQDSRGRPIKDATVWALQPAYHEGKRVVRSQDSFVPSHAKTNQKGEYLLESLPAGTYYVAARTNERPPQRIQSYSVNTFCQSESSNVSKVFSGSGPLFLMQHPSSVLGAAPAFSPSAANAAMAVAVSVRAGESVTANVAAAPAPTLRKIQGSVTDESGKKIKNARVTLIPRGPVLEDRAGFCGVDAPKGSFEIFNVVPGSYFLLATMNGRGSALAGRASIDLDQADIKDLKITARPRIDFGGTVVLQDGTAANNSKELQGLELRLIPTSPLDLPNSNAGPPETWSATAAADGSFVFSGVIPWDYRVVLSAPATAGMYLKSVRLDGADVLVDGFAIEHAPAPTLNVLVARDGGAIDGIAYQADKKPISDLTVVLIPDAPAHNRGDLYKIARTENSGSFRFEGIAPGDYQIFIWRRVPDGAWRDPQFLQSYTDTPRPVRVAPRSHELIEIHR